MDAKPVFTVYIYRDGPREASNTLYRCVEIKVDGEIIRDIPPEVRDLDFVGTVETQNSNELADIVSIYTGSQQGLEDELPGAGFTLVLSAAEKIAKSRIAN